MFRQLAIVSAACLSLGGFAISPAVAEEEEVAKPAGEGKVQIATTFRSSELMGIPVRNKEGQDLGKTEDFVVELNTGDVRYVALSFGGFAGFGDKLFAVPWKAMSFKFAEDDRYFVFDATTQQLEKMPGFDQNNWPDVADPAWRESIDKHFRTAAARPADKPAADDPDVKPTIETAKEPIIADVVFRASTIDGMKVRNAANENIGHVDELVVDVKAGKVKYAALSFGGFAGFGNKLFAIPLTAFTLKHGSDETFFVLDIDAEKLKAAPGFDKDHWPDTADPKWAEEIDKFYPDRTAERLDATPRK